MIYNYFIIIFAKRKFDKIGCINKLYLMLKKQTMKIG